ncbi:MAG: AAA family ATPase [Pseudomonadota bacterium]|jgi:general secretion pathway protein A
MTESAFWARLGLQRHPFPPTPDAASYFFTAHLQREYAEVRHCIEAGKGLVVVTGEVGMGKTTLVRRLLADLAASQVASALVFNTFLQDGALLAAILRDFGLDPTGSIDGDLARLNEFLVTQARGGRPCLLVVDDAQNLSESSLELIRLLSNLETGQTKLLQILLAGQPELMATLRRPTMRQLYSRIVKQCVLIGLKPEEVSRYVEFRLTQAGGSGRIELDRRAARALHRTSRGNLRRLHLILDRCLYGMVASGSRRIDAALVRSAVADLAEPGEAGRPGLFRRRALFAGGLAGMSTVALAALMWTQADRPQPPLPAVAQPTAVSQMTGPAQTPAPEPIPASRPVAEKPSATAGRARCLEVLRARRTGQPLDIRMRIMPAVLADQPVMDDDVCRFEEDGKAWLAWVPADEGQGPWEAGVDDPRVREVQRRLFERGLLAQRDIDGYLGPRTRAALRAFQQIVGVSATGLPDDFTLMLLRSFEITASQDKR